MMKYYETDYYKKGLKRLSKKFRSLEQDIQIVKQSVIELLHIHHIDNGGAFLIPGFCKEELLSYKVKKFASRSLRGTGVNSGFRLIYIYDCKQEYVYLVEIYHKNEKANNDAEILKDVLDRLIQK